MRVFQKSFSIHVDMDIRISKIYISDLDECNSNPCQNYGVCKDDVNHYTCSCLDGFAGLNCETGILCVESSSSNQETHVLSPR